MDEKKRKRESPSLNPMNGRLRLRSPSGSPNSHISFSQHLSPTAASRQWSPLATASRQGSPLAAASRQWSPLATASRQVTPLSQLGSLSSIIWSRPGTPNSYISFGQPSSSAISSRQGSPLSAPSRDRSASRGRSPSAAPSTTSSRQGSQLSSNRYEDDTEPISDITQRNGGLLYLLKPSKKILKKPTKKVIKKPTKKVIKKPSKNYRK